MEAIDAMKFVRQIKDRQNKISEITSGEKAQEADKAIKSVIDLFNGVWFLCPTKDRETCEAVKDDDD